MFYQLRITLAKVFNLSSDSALTDAHRKLIKGLITQLIAEKLCDDTNYVLAGEYKNKYGENTHFHYHFNFECDDSKDTLRRWLVRKSEEREYKLKGKESYALSLAENPDDYHRWFRYCLKEAYYPKYTRYVPSSGEPSLSDLAKLAKDERERTVKSNLAHRARSLEKVTYFDKIIKKMEKKPADERPQTKRSIYVFITRFYVDDKKPVNPVTIRGYTYQYMLSKKLITYDQFYDYFNK